MEKFIPQILGNDNFTAPVTLERANRRTERPITAKFLNFRDKEKVLRLARSKGGISFYPDYSADLQWRRDGFLGVKRMLLWPAQLRVKTGDLSRFSPLQLRYKVC